MCSNIRFECDSGMVYARSYGGYIGGKVGNGRLYTYIAPSGGNCERRRTW